MFRIHLIQEPFHEGGFHLTMVLRMPPKSLHIGQIGVSPETNKPSRIWSEKERKDNPPKHLCHVQTVLYPMGVWGPLFGWALKGSQEEPTTLRGPKFRETPTCFLSPHSPNARALTVQVPRTRETSHLIPPPPPPKKKKMMKIMTPDKQSRAV